MGKQAFLAIAILLVGCAEAGDPFTVEWECRAYETRLTKQLEIIAMCQDDATCMLRTDDYERLLSLEGQIKELCSG